VVGVGGHHRSRRRRTPLSAPPAGGGEPATADAVFAALADPTRRQLVDRLAASGELNATQLGAGMPMTRQAVAKHLAALEAAGVVSAERQGREVRYRLDGEAVAQAAAWLRDVGTRWDRRLAALRRHLGDRPSGG
jgi:DNA-binding transcriptional ArsR family regulator